MIFSISDHKTGDAEMSGWGTEESCADCAEECGYAWYDARGEGEEALRRPEPEGIPVPPSQHLPASRV